MRIIEKFGWQPEYSEPFWYRRESLGVYFQNVKNEEEVFIENVYWNALLGEIESPAYNIFSVTSQEDNLTDLYSIIRETLRKNGKTGKIKLTDSDVSAVVKILFHEGTIDFYQGPLGKNHKARMYLQKSKKS